MRVSVIGTQKVDFVDDKSGRVIQGLSVYGAFENRYVDGLKTNKFFISNNHECVSQIVPDCDIEITFDMNGKIDTVNVY